MNTKKIATIGILAVKIPKALTAFAIDSLVMIVGLPIAHKVEGKI